MDGNIFIDKNVLYWSVNSTDPGEKLLDKNDRFAIQVLYTVNNICELLKELLQG